MGVGGQDPGRAGRCCAGATPVVRGEGGGAVSGIGESAGQSREGILGRIRLAGEAWVGPENSVRMS